MKICHVNYYAKTGGAAVAAKRLHEGLLKLHVDSQFLAVEPQDDDTVIQIGTPFRRTMMKIFQRVVWRSYKLARSENYSGHGFEFFPGGLVPEILAFQPDIVHLHSIVGEMMSIREIGELCRRTKVVWTFHDAWPYTGTEQYYIPGTIPRYKMGYLPSNHDNHGIDLDRFYWTLKRKYWKDLPCLIVSPSNYLATEIQESLLFKEIPVTVIPHGIDLDLYAPGDRSQACLRLNLDEKQHYIGVAAVDLFNHVKGGDLVANFLHQAKDKIGDYTVLIAGHNFPSNLFPQNRIQYLGALSAVQMQDFFQVIDVFFNPTRLESFGLTNLEAMASGTPVLSTNQAAIPEVVEHLHTGYLASPNDINDFIAGFESIVSRLGIMREKSRTRAIKYFSQKDMVQKYLDIYQQLTDGDFK